MSVATILIEPAKAQDLAELLALLTAVNLPTDGVADHLSTALVARDGGRIVGSAALEHYGAAALLRSVAVASDYQGRKLGQQLTQAILDEAAVRGIRQVYLLTETAADFFPRFGFKIVDRSSVDPAVQQSVEFTSACPASAVVMMRST